MGRLRRFDGQRFLGARDTMVFYDCDEVEQFAELALREEEEGLSQGNLIQTFAPDTALEAVNRSFRPAR